MRANYWNVYMIPDPVMSRVKSHQLEPGKRTEQKRANGLIIQTRIFELSLEVWLIINCMQDFFFKNLFCRKLRNRQCESLFVGRNLRAVI